MIDTRGDQSVKELAEAKGVPAEWGKQAVRSAIPWQYVFWLLGHCPSIQIPIPKQKPQPSLPEIAGTVGNHSMFGTAECGGHKWSGGCSGDH